MKVPEFDKHLKKAGGYSGRNVVEITIEMKTIIQKPLMIKILKVFILKVRKESDCQSSGINGNKTDKINLV